jgi:hypothetical protein
MISIIFFDIISLMLSVIIDADAAADFAISPIFARQIAFADFAAIFHTLSRCFQFHTRGARAQRAPQRARSDAPPLLPLFFMPPLRY